MMLQEIKKGEVAEHSGVVISRRDYMILEEELERRWRKSCLEARVNAGFDY